MTSITALPTESLNILLLEDYNLDAELVRTELNRKHPGWQIDHVKSKEGFETYLQHHHPDVVLSDYSMPQFNGMEAFLKVKELGLEIPFIIVTGDLPEETAIECIRKGIDDYIIKSSMLRLDVAIQNAVEKKIKERERELIQEQLRQSERRYKSIFDHAGVPIVEFSSGVDISTLASKSENRQDQKNKLKDFIRSLVVMEANEEAIRCFEAVSRKQFIETFDQIFYKQLCRFILKGIKALTEDQLYLEEEVILRTFKGHKKHFMVKAVYEAERENFFTVSFIDVTGERIAEKRSLVMMERLEDTVAQRMLELSELNEKLRLEAEDRERINEVMRDNYIAMTESIIAAKRIQELLLPNQSEIANGFQDAFVYMRPKDIVSGDFYWYYEREDERWIACVDCTGHGVPGAFMSMISSKMLNQSVIEQKEGDPSKVLEMINNYIVKELKQHHTGTLTHAGMDISLCKFDYKDKTLKFAGAYQTLYRKRGDQITEFKGDRRSLGGTFKHKENQFHLHEAPFEEGDLFYMTSDGFVDQFGGPKNKKFTRRRWLSLLSSMEGDNMYEHEMVIKSAFQDWKGAYEQIDDILVMGLRA